MYSNKNINNTNKTFIRTHNLEFFVVLFVMMKTLKESLPGAGILHIECILHIAYWVQHFPQHHLSGSGIAQLEFYHCREPAWGALPMTKVMRKEARHTQRRDRASGVPLEILEHLPPKTRVCLLSALCFHLHLWLYGGLSPTTSLWEKS